MSSGSNINGQSQVPSQVKYPWRSTIRTVVQAAVALLTMLPYVLAGLDVNEATATGLIGQLLFISGVLAKVMAMPQVNLWLERYIPWLAAAPSNTTPARY